MGAGQALGAAGSVFGGIQAGKAGREEASRAGRDTVKAAKAKGEEIDKLQGKQTLDFLSSGVLLEGSPLLALQETQDKGSAEVGDVLESGFREANKARRAGRDALIGSVFQAGSQGMG